MLKGVDNGRFYNESYIDHLDVGMEDLIVILSEQRIVMIRSKSLRTEWDCPFNGCFLCNYLDLQVIRSEQGGISLVLKGRHAARAKIIPCIDRATHERFKAKLELAFSEFISKFAPSEL